jgi:hypothetical protein
MALNKAGLKSSIRSLQDNKPTTITKAAEEWSSAIYIYSSLGMAGPAKPILIQADLQSKFLASMNSQKFMDNLGTDLASWWATVLWVGPSFTGITIVPPPMNSAQIGKDINTEKSTSSTVDIRISDEIDVWTKQIKAMLTNTVSGIVAIFPVI